MKWFLIICGVIVFSLGVNSYTERSNIYWVNVGVNMDKTLNPNTHNQGED